MDQVSHSLFIHSFNFIASSQSFNQNKNHNSHNFISNLPKNLLLTNTQQQPIQLTVITVLPKLPMITQKSTTHIQRTKQQPTKRKAQYLRKRRSHSNQIFWVEIHIRPYLLIWLKCLLKHPRNFSFSIDYNQQKFYTCDDFERCRNAGNQWSCESYRGREMQATIQIYPFLLEGFTR